MPRQASPLYGNKIVTLATSYVNLSHIVIVLLRLAYPNRCPSVEKNKLNTGQQAIVSLH